MRGKFMQSKKSHTAAKFVRPSTLEALESRTLLSTYYVSTQGNDGAAGSSSSPWRTLQQAANMVRAGDNVIVQAGTYSGFQLTTDGTASARITFQAQPGVLINNRNSSTQDGINLEGASYVTIDGFKIAPASGVTMRSGIRAVESTGVIIRNNNIDRPSWWGIVTGFAENVLIEGNTTTNSINQHGIYVGYGADNPIVRNNISYGNKQCGIQLNSDATGGGDGIITGAIIEGNTVYNNSVGGGAGLNFDGVSNSTVRNNLFYNNSSNAIALYQVDGTQGARNNVIVNNTIVQPNTGYYAVSIVSGSSASSGNKVFNNILIGRSGAIGIDSASRSGFVSDYNAVNDKLSTDASSPISFSSWRSATGQDAHSFIGSTTNLFANYSGNDYHLATSSPAVDTGTSNSAPVTDKDGKARPAGAGYDIGAYEYNGSTPTATAPAAPSALTATAASTSQIALKWTDNSSNETGFLIERATGTGSFTQIASVGAGVTSFTDSGLTASTAYSYRVRATNAAGNSAYSNTAAATTQASTPTVTIPSAPSALTATAASSSQINLKWTDNSNNETGFLIERATGTGTFTQIASVGAGVTSFTSSGLTASTAYSYRVRATNSAGNSAYSNTASATTQASTPTTTIPTAPSALAATAVSSSQVALKWTDNSSNESGFLVERATGTGTFTQIASVGAGVTSFTDSGLAASTAYSYRVRATNSAGNSAYSATATATTQAPVTSTTQTLWNASATPTIASDSDPNAVELGMKFTSDVAGSITGIRFYKGAGNTGTHTGHLWSSSGQLLASVTFTNETASGWQQANFSQPVAINPNTTYTISYYAPAGHYAADLNYFPAAGIANGSLHGLNSVYRYGTTTALPTSNYQSTNYWVDVVFNAGTPIQQAPAAPSALTATAASTSQINLKWTDNSNNENGFLIERATGTGTFTQIASVGAGVTSFTDSGLAASTAYSYRVRATNSAGNSAYSNTATATTQAPVTSTTQTLWNASVVPTVTSDSDPNAVELGMKFKSSQAGYITGIRFYKGAGNGGTHTAHLWSSSGQLLASATFTAESAAGWQEVKFAKPVAIAANTTYTASYYAPQGHYAADAGYFASGSKTTGSLTAIGGVYKYGTSGFPTSTYNYSNYWVDVLFQA